VQGLPIRRKGATIEEAQTRKPENDFALLHVACGLLAFGRRGYWDSLSGGQGALMSEPGQNTGGHRFCRRDDLICTIPLAHFIRLMEKKNDVQKIILSPPFWV
jgi:hypothetical protein